MNSQLSHTRLADSAVWPCCYAGCRLMTAEEPGATVLQQPPVPPLPPLFPPPRAAATAPLSAADTAYGQRQPLRLLCYFLHRYLEFRRPEIESLAFSAAGCAAASLDWGAPPGGCEDSPFWSVTLPSEAVAAAVARRSVLLKAFLEVWGEGDTAAACGAAAEAHPAAAPGSPFLAAGTTFRVVVDGFGVHHSMAEQRTALGCLERLPFGGDVDLRAPQHEFWLVQVADTRSQPFAGLPPVPGRWLFGRLVARGGARRAPLVRLDLRTRRYLGPTTMDAEVALLMCAQARHPSLVVRACTAVCSSIALPLILRPNARAQALLGPGRLAFDPFAGTGGVLLAAAAVGALTMGADIDVRTLRDGKPAPPPPPGECGGAAGAAGAAAGRVTVWTNFGDAGLAAPLALLHADASALPLRPGLVGWCHAVVTDPPYGVRAGGRRGGGRRVDPATGLPRPVAPHLRDSHVPSTRPYSLADCADDLLDTAARALAPGGRLVFFVPEARSRRRLYLFCVGIGDWFGFCVSVCHLPLFVSPLILRARRPPPPATTRAGAVAGHAPAGGCVVAPVPGACGVLAAGALPPPRPPTCHHGPHRAAVGRRRPRAAAAAPRGGGGGGGGAGSGRRGARGGRGGRVRGGRSRGGARRRGRVRRSRLRRRTRRRLPAARRPGGGRRRRGGLRGRAGGAVGAAQGQADVT